MSEKTLGSAEIWYFWNVDAGTPAYEVIGCVTNNGLTRNREAVTSVTKCNPNVTETSVGTFSYEGTIEGEAIKPESGKIGLDILESWIEDDTKAKITWKSVKTYADASEKVRYGTAVITSLEQSAPADNENITFSISLTGDGKPTSTDPQA